MATFGKSYPCHFRKSYPCHLVKSLIIYVWHAPRHVACCVLLLVYTYKYMYNSTPGPTETPTSVSTPGPTASPTTSGPTSSPTATPTPAMVIWTVRASALKIYSLLLSATATPTVYALIRKLSLVPLTRLMTRACRLAKRMASAGSDVAWPILQLYVLAQQIRHSTTKSTMSRQRFQRNSSRMGNCTLNFTPS